MKKHSRISGSLLAAAAAGAFATVAIVAGCNQAKAEMQCENSSACKGHGACKSASNSCKGQNACKGQGMTMQKSEADCAAAQSTAKQ